MGHHYLDYRATFENGLRIGIAVKPSRLAARHGFRTRMPAIVHAAVPTVVDKVVVVTERHIHPAEFDNTLLFHAACRPVHEEDKVIEDLRAPIMVRHLLDEGPHDGMTLFGVARAIHEKSFSLFGGSGSTARR